MAKSYSRRGKGSSGTVLLLFLLGLLAVLFLLFLSGNSTQGLLGSRDSDIIILSDTEVSDEEKTLEPKENEIEETPYIDGTDTSGTLAVTVLCLAIFGGVLFFMQQKKRERRRYGGKARSKLLRIPKRISLRGSGRKKAKKSGES